MTSPRGTASRLAGPLLLSLACLMVGASPAAARHKGSRNLERGLRGRNDIIFFCDFESPHWYKAWGLGKVPSRGKSHTATVRSDPDRKFEPFHGKALRAMIARGDRSSSLDGMDFRFKKQLGREPEEIYWRYYLRFSSDWHPKGQGKLPGFGGTYGRGGWGGKRSNGRNGWSARGWYWDQNRADHNVLIGWYCYYADMNNPNNRNYGENWGWRQVGWNQWYCIDQHCRMNTPGKKDGILRAWVDGKLVHEKKDIRYRDVANIKIETIWMTIWFGETSSTDVHLYIDNVVIARKYIGPCPDYHNYPMFDTGALIEGNKLTSLKLIRRYLVKGQLGRALARAERGIYSRYAFYAAGSKVVLKAFTVWADGALAALTRLKETDPEKAIDGLNHLVKQLGTTKLGRRLRKTAAAWNRKLKPKPKPTLKPVLRKPKTRTPEEQAKPKLSIARGYLRYNRKDQARKILESIIKDYPDTSSAKEAKKELQRLK